VKARKRMLIGEEQAQASGGAAWTLS